MPLSLHYCLIGYVSFVPNSRPPPHYKSAPLTVKQSDSPTLALLLNTLRSLQWRHPPSRSTLCRPLAGLPGTAPATSRLSNSPEGPPRTLYICPSNSPLACFIYVSAVCLPLFKRIFWFVSAGQRGRRMSPSRFYIVGYATLTSIKLRTSGEILFTLLSPGE